VCPRTHRAGGMGDGEACPEWSEGTPPLQLTHRAAVGYVIPPPWGSLNAWRIHRVVYDQGDHEIDAGAFIASRQPRHRFGAVGLFKGATLRTHGIHSMLWLADSTRG
jgi:hypothetical protein